MTLVDNDFNDVFTLATMHAGMTVAQTNTLLLDMNWASRTACVDLDSKSNFARRKQLRKDVTLLGQREQAAVLQSVIDNQQIKQLVGQVDGNYPTRGRDSRVCLVSLLLELEVDNCKQLRMAGQVVIKRRKQAAAVEVAGDDGGNADGDADVGGAHGDVDGDADGGGADDADVDGGDVDGGDVDGGAGGTGGDGDGEDVDGEDADAVFDAASEELEGIAEVWVTCSAQQMETKGVEYLLNNQVRKLVDAGKQLKLATDGDNKIKNQLKDMGVQQLLDVAHVKKNILKNVQGIVKVNKFWGDDYKGADTKIGRENFHRLVNSISTSVQLCVRKVREENWSAEDVQQKLLRTIAHFEGLMTFFL